MSQSSSLTLSSNSGILRELVTPCHICAGTIPADQIGPNDTKQFNAIWDTGATGSVITQRVVDTCGLQPIGIAQVHGVHGTKESNIYLVNIRLPNGVMFPGIPVTQGDLPEDKAQVLIGMDIITAGDFSITNFGGKTIFSFRAPSQLHVDFVKEHNANLQLAQFSHGGKKRQKKRKRHGEKGKGHKKK
jgi:hypothetical protein